MRHEDERVPADRRLCSALVDLSAHLHHELELVDDEMGRDPRSATRRLLGALRASRRTAVTLRSLLRRV